MGEIDLGGQECRRGNADAAFLGKPCQRGGKQGERAREILVNANLRLPDRNPRTREFAKDLQVPVAELTGRAALLVDDNPTAREVLSDMTRRLGLHVDVSESGEQALIRMQQAAAEGKPHQVLLTDWKMPGMDGIHFAREALAMPPEHRPCVLLVTAFAREEALKAAEGIGLAGVINKPVTPSTLLDTLSRVLGEQMPAQPAAAEPRDAVEPAAPSDLRRRI